MCIEDIFQYNSDYSFTIVVIPLPQKNNNNSVLLSKYFVIKYGITMSNNVNTSTAQDHVDTKVRCHMIVKIKCVESVVK